MPERPENKSEAELREWAKAHIKKLTPEDVERALAGARERGWLTDDGFIWERDDV